MITQDDLGWWPDLAPTLRWRSATTYAQAARHSDVVSGHADGMNRDDHVRADRVMRTFGGPQRFYGMTSTYLNDSDSCLMWWMIEADLTDTKLVNQATTDRLHSVQNALVTHFDILTRTEQSPASTTGSADV